MVDDCCIKDTCKIKLPCSKILIPYSIVFQHGGLSSDLERVGEFSIGTNVQSKRYDNFQESI